MLDPTLLAPILANPLDDAPRLAAAALLPAGDPRAELVMVQCKLATRGLDRAKRATLKRRELELTTAHRPLFLSLTVGLEQARLRRGFVDEIEASASQLLGRADALFAAEPITRLTVKGANRGSLEGLAVAGAFARVLHLTVRGPIGDDGAAALAAALAKRTFPLLSLNLGGNGLTSKGLAALVGSLSGCRMLGLTDNAIGDDGVAVLTKAKALAALEVLFLTKNELTDDALVSLAKSACLPVLTRLGVAGNDDVTSDGLSKLAKSKKLRKLRWLEYTDADAFTDRVAVRGHSARA